MSVDASQFTASIAFSLAADTVTASNSYAPENSFMSKPPPFRRKHQLMLPDQIHHKFYLKPQPHEIRRQKILMNERTSRRVEFLALREAENIRCAEHTNMETALALMISQGGRVSGNTGKDL